MEYWKIVISLLFIIVLILVISYIMKKVVLKRLSFGHYDTNTVGCSIKNTLHIDTKNKIVVVQFHDIEYLIVVGDGHSSVISSSKKDS